MSRFRPFHLVVPAAASVLFLAGSSSAHIELLEPASRYPSNGNKSCPCGEGDSNRRCNVPAEESHDPNRSTDPAKITRLEVGSTITVQFDEYIGHSGRFRVAFDPDGADLSDFNDNVLADVPDPSDGRGDRQIEVTLPDTPCDNCTLQLIQAMHGDTENPVLDPAPLSTYYTCADIVLVPEGTLGDDPSGPELGGDSDAGVVPSFDDDDDGGGCAIARRPAPPSVEWALLALALGVSLRRRSARRAT